MKKAFLMLFLLCVCGVTYGQIRLNDGSILVSKRVSIGLKGGVNICKMLYTDSNVKIEHDFGFRPAAGVYIEIPVRRFLSISPEFLFIQRGTQTSYEYDVDYIINYKMNVRYIDFRVPFQFYWLVSNTFKPYAFVAPDFGYVLGGTISLEQKYLEIEEAHCDIGSANHSQYDFSILMGVGFRFDINMKNTSIFIKVEGGYNNGLLNTFSPKETEDGSTPLNVYAYNNTGYRFNRGIEVMLSIGMPLYFRQGTCSYFEKQSRW